MIGADITDQEFDRLRRFFENASGIRLADSKKVLVCGRLSRRLRHFGIETYRDYLALIESDREPGERQMAIDLLTTNETHFFREPTTCRTTAESSTTMALMRFVSLMSDLVQCSR
jgi:chemotaxis protein methyltransferase CheR